MTETVSQALARKWRPRDFPSLVGQQHVVQALSHALDTGRLHHAYLFTGTRGVGKTTIARIMAKAVNCEQGMSSHPCGVCRACTEIAQGRFVDLLEVDAATNTKVDEMRQLLENAMYAPTSGRYKVYVIDEVHMLSSSAFNAMLKTLEEPPGHVLFILATTDPQKIPATVLSRCLQFGLRQLAPDQISAHLAHILDTESVSHEPAALRLLAKAARGSLRDALSLTDQAIAYSAGQVTEATVRQMLGAVDQKAVLAILQALADGDGAALLQISNELAASSAPFAALLDELAAASYRLSVAQIAGVLDTEDPDQAALAQVQGALSPEALQLIYQIATHARAELHLAPEDSIGFGMALIRMLAFKPGTANGQHLGGGGVAQARAGSAPGSVSASARLAANLPAHPEVRAATAVYKAPAVPAVAPQPVTSQAVPATAPRAVPPVQAMAQAAQAKSQPAPQTFSQPEPDFTDASEPPPWFTDASDALGATAAPASAPALSARPALAPATSASVSSATVSSAPPAPLTAAKAGLSPASPSGLPSAQNWPDLSQQVPAKGLTRQALVQTELLSATMDAGVMQLTLLTGIKAYAEASMAGRIEQALSEYFGTPVRLSMQTGQVAQTAHAVQTENRKQAMEEARAAIDADPFIGQLKSMMGASVVQGSQRPLHEQGPADV